MDNCSILRLADLISRDIILHPFVALRRTCQVNRKCSPVICVQPFSLIPFIYHQQRNQGISALYKGLSSELLVKGITLGTETALANYTEWPRVISSKHFFEDSLKVLALRGISVALSTPFLCSAVIETVKSVIVVQDRPSFLDCLRDGFHRLLHLRSTPSNRMLPIWLLVVPTVFYHVAHSALWRVAQRCVEVFRSNIKPPKATPGYKRGQAHRSRIAQRRHQIDASESLAANESTIWQPSGEKYRQPDDLTLTYDPTETSMDSLETFDSDSAQISNSIFASLIADVVLLPVETVLDSLYIQGTRTIIDNCDETTVVLPVLTNYDGFSDCYQSILKFEGNLGLYKGLGAIVLQYSIHFLLFRSFCYLLREFQINTSASESNAPSKPSTSSKQQHQLRTSSKRPIKLEDDISGYYGDNLHSTPNYTTIHSNRLASDTYDYQGVSIGAAPTQEFGRLETEDNYSSDITASKTYTL